MTLVFLYGAPGVGKLTVARALQRLVGYRVFHNHLTFDLAAALIDPFTPGFLKMMQELRLRSLELAMDFGVEGVTFTMCYDHPKDMPVVEDIRRLLVDRGGTVHFVQLVCSLEEMKRRVAQPDREKYRKLTHPEKLDALLRDWDVSTPVVGHDSLQVDNTFVPADAVARMIVDAFGLQPLSEAMRA
jgi:chloramphenicol 3-O-phosphotransferase